MIRLASLAFERMDRSSSSGDDGATQTHPRDRAARKRNAPGPVWGEHGAPLSSTEEVRRLEERLLRGDADPSPGTSAVFDELLADDVLFVQSQGSSVGKGGVLSGHQPPRKRIFSKVENVEVEIRELGSAVAVSCRSNYEIQERAFYLRTLRVWKQVGESWKVVAVALTEVPKNEK